MLLGVRLGVGELEAVWVEVRVGGLEGRGLPLLLLLLLLPSCPPKPALGVKTAVKVADSRLGEGVGAEDREGGAEGAALLLPWAPPPLLAVALGLKERVELSETVAVELLLGRGEGEGLPLLLLLPLPPAVREAAPVLLPPSPLLLVPVGLPLPVPQLLPLPPLPLLPLPLGLLLPPARSAPPS